ncbi:MAG TPA: DUF4190 domain-containing protein [Pyrinomonadaceae bacterium]|nr:DUF4190 domain-containing protein [Pyrinomonadaceae bacterium]
MKRCPTCDKTFADGMKFCQTDGTLLVQDAPPADPYKTVVGNQSDIASAIPPLDPFKTMVAIPPKAQEDDLLQLPEEPDALKTMVVSQDELREGLRQSESKDEPELDLPPPSPFGGPVPIIEPKIVTPTDFPAAPPKPQEPSLNPPSFGDLSSPQSGVPKPSGASPSNINDEMSSGAAQNPPSPFDSQPFSNDFSTQSPYGNQENKPIPSPFDESMLGYQPPTAPPFDAPKPPLVKEIEPPYESNSPSSAQSPFQPPSPFGNADSFNQQMQQTEWTPPPAPVSEWQNQNIGSNTPFQPPPTGQDQTLAIVSLVCGILSILCCGLITGIPAIITGYMAKNNVDTNPNQYSGRGMALAGMILGSIGTVLFIIGIILQIALGGFSRF